MPPPLVVLDTNVATAAAMGWPGSVNNRVIDQVAAGSVRPAVSGDYMDELTRTMGKPYVERHASVGRAVYIALTLAYMGKAHVPPRHDWPSISDRKDWWVLDLAFESGADHIVTWNTRHLAPARSLGFDVLDPPGLLASLLV